jgi:hypothetical protein
MAVFTPTRHLCLFLFLPSLLFLAHARLPLDPSDYTALLLVQNNLGINGQRLPSRYPCNNPGVFCERRLSENNTYVLKITRLIFKSKQLGGFISPTIGKLSELRELSLADNNLLDHLPPQIVDCKKLEILDLGNNKFSGDVPYELSSLISLRFLDLSSNKFSGNLSFLKYFPNLETLSLGNNLFIGKIPKSIRSFRNLQFFDFSENDFLEGPLLEMNQIDLYPKRYIFAESPNSNSTKHGRAAGPTSQRDDNSNAPAPGPASAIGKHHKSSKRKVLGWILGFLVGAIVGSLSGFVFSVMFKLILAAIRGGRESGPVIYSQIIKRAEDLAFLEKDDALTSLEMIGKGGCGEVYKAELPGSNGKMIAVKKIIQPPKDGADISEEDSKLLNKKMRQIKSEINTVGLIRHRNLLSLLAHLSRPDCHLLVYEFMKNGSLQDMLTAVSRGERELDWLTRHRIAIGIASGLEYLHVSHNPRIIHRDLKPANVLLDDDMEARIADFGLAKAMLDAQTHITTSNVAGTVGYIAPEYHQTLKFTDKCDIYSFGVLLGVLVMGKLPSDEFFQHTNEMSLIRWMRNVMTSDNPSQAIDQKLIGNGFEEQMLLVLKIACFCTLDDPKQRPNSKDTRCMLSQIKH